MEIEPLAINMRHSYLLRDFSHLITKAMYNLLLTLWYPLVSCEQATDAALRRTHYLLGL